MLYPFKDINRADSVACKILLRSHTRNLTSINFNHPIWVLIESKIKVRPLRTRSLSRLASILLRKPLRTPGKKVFFQLLSLITQTTIKRVHTWLRRSYHPNETENKLANRNRLSTQWLVWRKSLSESRRLCVQQVGGLSWALRVFFVSTLTWIFLQSFFGRDDMFTFTWDDFFYTNLQLSQNFLHLILFQNIEHIIVQSGRIIYYLIKVKMFKKFIRKITSVEMRIAYRWRLLIAKRLWTLFGQFYFWESSKDRWRMRDEVKTIKLRLIWNNENCNRNTCCYAGS